MIVIKFGGTSVKDSSAMLQALNIVKGRIDKKPLVVLSACGGVTDKLISAIQIAATQNKNVSYILLKEIENHHINLVHELISDNYYNNLACEKVIDLCQNLKTLIDGVSLLQYCSPRSVDSASAFGELLSTTIFELALKAIGVNSHFLDAREIMKTDSTFTQANINFEQVKINSTKIVNDFINKGKVVVTQGFIGSDEEGLTTTLGRGGSDYSAAVFGAVMDAEEIQIWTDVSGVLSADPRLILNTFTIPEMSFKEVLELSFFGAKVLHPDTIKPAIENKIPVRVLNTFEPENSGTYILNKTTDDKAEINSLVLKNNCSLLGIRMNSMENINDLIFEVLKDISAFNKKIFYYAIANNKINVLLDTNEEDIPQSFIENYKKFDISIKGTSLICLCGQNLVTKQNDVKGIINKALEIIKEYSPTSILYGVTDTSIIATIPQDFGEKALKKLHELIK